LPPSRKKTTGQEASEGEVEPQVERRVSAIFAQDDSNQNANWQYHLIVIALQLKDQVMMKIIRHAFFGDHRSYWVNCEHASCKKNNWNSIVNVVSESEVNTQFRKREVCPKRKTRDLFPWNMVSRVWVIKVAQTLDSHVLYQRRHSLYSLCIFFCRKERRMLQSQRERDYWMNESISFNTIGLCPVSQVRFLLSGSKHHLPSQRLCNI
jgi:hypothetical protein